MLGTVLWLAAALAAVRPAAAQRSGEMPAVFDGVGVTEQLGDTLPTDLAFRDADGEVVRLGDYLDGETPVVFTLVYHSCPMLCNLLLDGFTRSMTELAWTAGEEFEVVTVSFAADETPEQAAAAKARYLETLGRPEAAGGWHFLTGDQASIDALTTALGYDYKWVEEAQQYAHPAAITLVSGEGVITRYLHGMDFPARTLRTALVEASDGTVGNTLDKLILYCFQYDPEDSGYVLHAVNAMKAGGFLTLLVLGSALFLFWRRERRQLDDEGVPL